MYIKSIIIIALFSSCINHTKKQNAERIANHDKKLEIYKVMKDPLYNRMSDSMRQWIDTFRQVLIDDQRYRILGLGVSNKNIQKQNSLDSINLIVVSRYLDKFKWPTFREIGFFGCKAIGMVIQHSPLKIQEKYYPKLLESFKKTSELNEFAALLEDRINMRNNRFQNYGTQLIKFKGKQTLYPVKNLDSLVVLRARLNLMPLNTYFTIMNAKWDLEFYKSVQSQLISKYKISSVQNLDSLKK